MRSNAKGTSALPLLLLVLSSMFVLNLTGALAGGETPGLVDNLNDYSFTYQRSENMNRLDDLNFDFFDGDKSRLCRTTLDEGNVVYKTEYDIESFFIDTYYWPSAVMEDVKVYVSADAADYKQVALERSEIIGPWNRVVFEAYEMPVAHARFMKITVTGKVEPWTPQIARVMVNATVAPVTATPAPCKLMEPADVTLSTKTSGAEIFFSTTQEPTVRPYTGPIRVTNSTKITAYAKKTGLSESVTRTLVYTSAADEIVDRYGQLKKASFPGKVTKDEELRADLAADKAYYASLKPPKRDPYGGLLDSKKKYGLHATGFFHVEKIPNGRMVLVTPLGNAYFSLGVNGTGYNGDTYTKVAGREYVYEWLPPLDKYGTYATAYSNSGQDFSFYMANRIKKYGRPTLPKEFTRECVDRITKWGFTSTGGWSDVDTCKEIGFPNVRHLSIYDSIPEGRVSGIGFFDIFAEGVVKKIELKLAEELPFYKDDPTLIGYFVDNELEYHRIKSVIPKAQASKVAAKKRLVDMLKEGYKGEIKQLNEAWETNFKSFDEMYEAALAIGTDAANDDINAFIRFYLDTYYGTVARLFRKYDPNHLLLGERWFVTPLKDDTLRAYLCEAAGKYFDVLSYNYYTYEVSLALLQDMHVKSGGKPIILSEFLFAEPTQGLTRGVRVVADEQEKGRAYRNYVEQAASTGFVVGAHWFEYLDQAATGRWFQGYTGENFATGLLNVADRPHKRVLSSMMVTNYNIYDIALGLKKPYLYDFGPERSERQSNKSMQIAKTPAPIKIDGVIDAEWSVSKPALLDKRDRVLGSVGDALSAEFRYAWDMECLYVAAHMKDPTPMKNNNIGFDVWNGDAIEMFIGPVSVDQGGGLRAKDNQVILSAGRDYGDQFFWYNTSVQTPVKFEVKMDADGQGYTIEAAIPWTVLNVPDPGNGRRLRFDFGFDDGDGTGRQAQWFWNGVDGNHVSRDKWGQAVLVDKI